MAYVLFVSSIQAQELSLFEEIEPDNDANSRGRSPRMNAIPRDNEPSLSLIGITRIGNTYSVILRTGEDNSILVKAPENNSVIIPGFPGYSISQIGSKNINLNYPENSSCVESLASGIKCLDDQVARLSLTKTEPLKAARSSELESSQQTENDVEAPINPFEAITRRAARPDSELRQDNQFRPRRINPEDVPPGMRIVSTPFGDRLVEDE
tara:strand:+ start:444 stop:1073 length:630 start_codon:yes stop_codon:yes gene_type:complete